VTPLQTPVVAALSSLLNPAVAIAGLAVLALLVAAASASVYRWYARDRAPTHVPLLVALAAVTGYLNVKTALGEVIAGETAVLAVDVAAFNVAALVVAALVVPVGHRLGDRIAADLGTAAGSREVDAVSPLVRAVSRVITVTLPEEIDDLEGYDPVDEETRASLAGTTLAFPRGLTVAELRDRLVVHLKTDYEVGRVDVELTEDGDVAYLAVGGRVAGLGPTLAPGTAAVAVRGDPANTASAGDTVQVWQPAERPECLATAEIRAVVGDTVTLAVDAADAEALAGGSYRLVTLPTEPRPDHEFATLLRAADETMGAVRIDADSPLAGVTVGALAVAVAARRPVDGSVEAFPPRRRVVSAGDTLYVVARPEEIRRLETHAASEQTAAGAETRAA
jgi:hypothetical protein